MVRQEVIVRRRASETVGQRVRRLRRRLGLTQKELCQVARIDQGFLSAIENDKRSPSPRTLKALAIALDVPEAVLIGTGIDHDAPQPLETDRLPLLGSIPAGRPAESQEQLEMFPVLKHLWAPDRYCLRLTFDSMEPTLKPDDIVLVHYRPDVDPTLVQGRICACLVDGQPTLKRVTVERRPSGQAVILRGDNPAIEPMIVDESADFSIQGVVIRLVSREL